MKKNIFIDKYIAFEVPDEEIKASIKTIIDFENFITKDIDDSSIVEIKKYLEYLISTNENSLNNIIHIARYYYYVDMREHYIHMTKYFNTFNVIETILKRIDEKESINEEFTLPPFGLDSELLPEETKRFMNKLKKYFTVDECKQILTGNNHNLPKESLNEEIKFYNESKSFKEYLEDRHQRKLAELTRHMYEDKIWFEQIITDEVLDFVSNNKEVLSGVIKDNKLHITKIPYDTKSYLEAESDDLKRFHACHCTFVRENLKKGKYDIDKDWCYCSAGFAKFPFEVILDQELDVKLVETPLDGGMLCRFEIDLTNVDYKKAE